MAAQPPTPAQSPFPSQYPHAAGSPLPSTMLRPLKQILYDSEWLVRGKLAHGLRFFQRPVGMSFTVRPKRSKTICDTNLTLTGTLSNPCEFSLLGFSMKIFGLSSREKQNMLCDAAVSFLCRGNRIYLQVPAILLPEPWADKGSYETLGMRPMTPPTDAERAMAALQSNDTLDLDDPGKEAAKKAVEEESEEGSEADKICMYNFTCGRAALRLRPTESFGMMLEWPHGGYMPLRNCKICLFMHGLFWAPL